jgi:TPR repeat protein
MSKLAHSLFIIVAGVALASARAAAADYLTGLEHYQKKEYKDAHGELLPGAAAGDARAQFLIGEMYYAGQYLQQDASAAAQWYQKAAEQGHAHAQLTLARMLSRGTDVPRDLIAAYQWASLGAHRVDGQMREKALHFSDTLAVLLKEAELKRAKAAIAAWRPRITRADDAATRAMRPLWNGTGFFVNASGTLLTNAHVAYMCPRLIVFYGDREADGTLRDVDFAADLATVQAALKPAGFARFAEAGRPKAGTAVKVTGYAVRRTKVRRALSFDGTVLDASPADGSVAWYQTSVPIYRGQSGGPALGADGQVIGVARAFRAGSANESLEETRDGQAMIVAVESISRFLGMTQTAFERVRPQDSAPTSRHESAPDFIAFVQCLGH